MIKNAGLLGLLLLSVIGCKSYIQVYDTRGANVEFKDDFYIFENDTLRISYSFWKEKGLMAFSIFNKLDRPIYVDWKKSSYIDNSVKLDYWMDEEKRRTLAYYGSYFYTGPNLRPVDVYGNTTGVALTTSVKEERITFIPPLSYYSRSQFHILPRRFIKLDRGSSYTEETRRDKPKKKTKVYEQKYSNANSPIVFRNYLTFSLNEKFDKEFHVDNEFYVHNIKEMDSRHFEYSVIDENIKVGTFYLKDDYGNILKFSDYKKGSSFFIPIPKKGSVAKRK